MSDQTLRVRRYRVLNMEPEFPVKLSEFDKLENAKRFAREWDGDNLVIIERTCECPMPVMYLEEEEGVLRVLGGKLQIEAVSNGYVWNKDEDFKDPSAYLERRWEYAGYG